MRFSWSSSRPTCAKQIKTFLFHDKKSSHMATRILVSYWPYKWQNHGIHPTHLKTIFPSKFLFQDVLDYHNNLQKTNQQEWHLTLTFELAYEQALIHCGTSKSEDTRVELAREVTHFQWHTSLTGSSLTALSQFACSAAYESLHTVYIRRYWVKLWVRSFGI